MPKFSKIIQCECISQHCCVQTPAVWTWGNENLFFCGCRGVHPPQQDQDDGRTRITVVRKQAERKCLHCLALSFPFLFPFYSVQTPQLWDSAARVYIWPSCFSSPWKCSSSLRQWHASLTHPTLLDPIKLTVKTDHYKSSSLKVNLIQRYFFKP